MNEVIKKFGKVKRVEQVGHKAYDLVSPVMVGDVLEDCKMHITETQIVKLNDLWIDEFGNKSLQQIDRENTKEIKRPCSLHDVDNGYGDNDFHKGFNIIVDTLTPEAQKLFNFLKEL